MKDLAKLDRAKNIAFFGLGIAFTALIGSSIMLMRSIAPPEPMSCTDARVEAMAMRACLAHRPQCLIEDGPTAFKVYHEAMEIADRCLTEGIRQ